MSLFVAAEPQTLDGEWLKRLNVWLRDIGTGMDDDEVSEFSMRVDIDALSAYHAAVGKRTEKIVEALTPEDLDEVADPSEIRKAISDEALLRENADWVEGNFSGRPQGWFLAQLGLAHNYGLRGEHRQKSHGHQWAVTARTA